MTLRRSSCSSFAHVALLVLLASGCSATGASTPGNTLAQGGIHGGNGGSGNAGVGGGGGITSASTNVTDLGGGANTGGSPGAGGGALTTGGVPATGGAPPTGGMPATGGTTCTKGTQIGSTYSTNYFVMAFPQLQPFYIFNNGWSTSSTELTNAGTLENISAYDTCTAGTISWSTTYNWSGANNTVKAYPAAILGWQNTKGFQVNPAVSGMPKAISSLTSAKCSWAFTVTGGAAQNISFDIWVHNTTCSSTAITTTTTPSDEVMIWLYSSGGVNPIGYGGSTSQVTISGATWTLYTGTTTVNGASVAVHSFVRASSTAAIQNLDILAFLNNLNMGSKCLSSIQAGTEVFTGAGTLKTDSYSCTLQ
jgi:xyloglucan-specific endo-beta-1,4-glucanase